MHTTTTLSRTYIHTQVNAQGDDSDSSIYNSADAELELPFWCPPADESGFSRLERLEMAAEYDVWQVHMHDDSCSFVYECIFYVYICMYGLKWLQSTMCDRCICVMISVVLCMNVYFVCVYVYYTICMQYMPLIHIQTHVYTYE